MESTVAFRSKSIEWVAENVLRVGTTRSDNPALDNLVLVNATAEPIRHAQISLGKYETFDLLDIPGGEQISLQMDRGPTSIVCNGTSQLKNEFLLIVDKPQGTILPTGATRFELIIKPQDLK